MQLQEEDKVISLAQSKKLIKLWLNEASVKSWIENHISYAWYRTSQDYPWQYNLTLSSYGKWEKEFMRYPAYNGKEILSIIKSKLNNATFDKKIFESIKLPHTRDDIYLGKALWDMLIYLLENNLLPTTTNEA